MHLFEGIERKRLTSPAAYGGFRYALSPIERAIEITRKAIFISHSLPGGGSVRVSRDGRFQLLFRDLAQVYLPPAHFSGTPGRLYQADAAWAALLERAEGLLVFDWASRDVEYPATATQVKEYLTLVKKLLAEAESFRPLYTSLVGEMQEYYCLLLLTAPEETTGQKRWESLFEMLATARDEYFFSPGKKTGEHFIFAAHRLTSSFAYEEIFRGKDKASLYWQERARLQLAKVETLLMLDAH